MAEGRKKNTTRRERTDLSSGQLAIGHLITEKMADKRKGKKGLEEDNFGVRPIPSIHSLEESSHRSFRCRQS